MRGVVSLNGEEMIFLNSEEQKKHLDKADRKKYIRGIERLIRLLRSRVRKSN